MVRIERVVAALVVLVGLGGCSSSSGGGSNGTTGFPGMPSVQQPGAVAGGAAGAGSVGDNTGQALPNTGQAPGSSGQANPGTDSSATGNPPAAMDGTPPASGNSGAGTQASGDGAGVSAAAMDPTTPFSMLPESCKGFDVAGLQYSPGGDTLPNKCAPFDNVYNNPYAVRCVEADPSYSTDYPGDDFCILPPDPADGTQVHVGPADYANPGPGFVMQPGDEITNWYYTKAPNTEDHYFYRVDARMRPGSHHMINNMLDADKPDGWSAAGDLGINFGTGGGSSGTRSFPGAQRPDTDRPEGLLEIPPENANLGDQIKAHQQFSLNLHHFNLTNGPILREVWINIWYKDAADVTEPMGGIAIFGNPADVSIGPGQHQVLQYTCDVQGNTRIISLNGHRHAHTDRFGVWLTKASGENVEIYDSFNWDDMPTYSYDSISQNPVPDVDNGVDGAFSGMLNVSKGDKIHFVCDINNDSTTALRFANEVETGEMCILFGSRTGDSLCSFLTRDP